MLHESASSTDRPIPITEGEIETQVDKIAWMGEKVIGLPQSLMELLALGSVIPDWGVQNFAKHRAIFESAQHHRILHIRIVKVNISTKTAKIGPNVEAQRQHRALTEMRAQVDMCFMRSRILDVLPRQRRNACGIEA